MQGHKSIYVDFVDYDEIAHHAGVTRAESLASLYGLDQVVGSLAAFAALGSRAAHVSDRARERPRTVAGHHVPAALRGVARGVRHRALRPATPPSSAQQEQEARGRVTSLVLGLGEKSVAGRVVSSAVPDAPEADPEAPGIAVVGSGNLGGSLVH